MNSKHTLRAAKYSFSSKEKKIAKTLYKIEIKNINIDELDNIVPFQIEKHY